jgi:hypothetical protein
MASLVLKHKFQSADFIVGLGISSQFNFRVFLTVDLDYFLTLLVVVFVGSAFQEADSDTSKTLFAINNAPVVVLFSVF